MSEILTPKKLLLIPLEQLQNELKRTNEKKNNLIRAKDYEGAARIRDWEKDLIHALELRSAEVKQQ